MEENLVHVVFGDSPAGLMKLALRQIGVADGILSYPDNLAFGPIAIETQRARQSWLECNLSAAAFDPYPCPTCAEMADFWNGFGHTGDTYIIWYSRRCSREYCGFLECLWRASPDAEIRANDLTSRTVSHTRNGQPEDMPAPPVSHLAPDRLAELYGSWTPLSEPEITGFREQWRRLRIDNAPFRILANRRLISAPLDAFDEDLLSNTGTHWRKAAMVVALAMSKGWDTDVYNSIGDLPLYSRLLHLVDTGALVACGDRTHMGRLEVRKPS